MHAMTRVGFIGLGAMGASMAGHLHGIGDDDIVASGKTDQLESGADVERHVVDGASEQVAAAEARRLPWSWA